MNAMTTYLMTVESHDEGDLLRVKFGEPAQNDVITPDAAAALEVLIESGQMAGGKVLRVNGPMSLPVAFVIAHRVGHLYGAIGVYDPKLGGKYVVSISHNPEYAVGMLLD
jgi:CRISPR-associated protein Csx3